MTSTDVLDRVLGGTADLISGVRPAQRDLPTDCPGFTVGDLVDHIVGWIQVFDASANDRKASVDPNDFHSGDDPAAQFRASARGFVDGWKEHGLDRKVHFTGGEQPAEMVFNMALMEYATHAWDLATATGQAIPFSSDDMEDVFRSADGMVPDEYRGDEMPFGPVVPVPADAPAIERLVAYLGRRPRP